MQRLGSSRGLLGNANGNMTDDLMTPSQHIVSSNSPAKEIHEEFAMTCEYIMCKMKMYLVYVGVLQTTKTTANFAT